MIKNIFITFRPTQITKNGIIFFPLFFSTYLWWDNTDIASKLYILAHGAAVFLIFTLLSWGIYTVNDIVDIKEDKANPHNSNRPIASGALPVGYGILASVLVLGLGIASAFAIAPVIGYIAIAFVVINMSYTFGVKRILILDIMFIAASFVVRVSAGTQALDVAIPEDIIPTPWLYIVTAQGALLLAASKRKAELKSLGLNTLAQSRAVLSKYTVPLLNQIITVSVASALVSYSVYTFLISSNIAVGIVSSPLTATIPMVAFGLLRYLYISESQYSAVDPSKVFLHDRPLQACILLWLITSGIILTLFN